MRSPTLKYFLEKRHVDHGGAMVEFAIVLPLLLILVFGIIEFGVLLHDKAILTNASREGARLGIVYAHDENDEDDLTDDTYYPDDDAIETAVKKYLNILPNQNPRLISFGSDSHLTIAIDPSEATRIKLASGTGTDLAVKLTYKFEFLIFSNIISLFSGSLDDFLIIKAETVMRLE